MNLVFQLGARPSLPEAQQLSEALDRQPGVVSALVDPQLGKVYVSFEPDLIGDLTLQRVVEAMGYRVSSEGEAQEFETDTPGYLSEARDERFMLDQAAAMTRDAEFRLPDAEGGGP